MGAPMALVPLAALDGLLGPNASTGAPVALLPLAALDGKRAVMRRERTLLPNPWMHLTVITASGMSVGGAMQTAAAQPHAPIAKCDRMLVKPPLSSAAVREAALSAYFQGPGSLAQGRVHGRMFALGCRYGREPSARSSRIGKALSNAAFHFGRRSPEQLLEGALQTGVGAGDVAVYGCAEDALYVALRARGVDKKQVARIRKQAIAALNCYRKARGQAAYTDAQLKGRAEARRRVLSKSQRALNRSWANRRNEVTRVKDRQRTFFGTAAADSPDRPSRLRREAAAYIEEKQPSQAVIALEEAVRILVAAFGGTDAETVAAKAELRAARASVIRSGQQTPLPQACAKRLPAPALTPKALDEARLGYHDALIDRIPLPPAMAGLVCKTLRHDPGFRGSSWNDASYADALYDNAKRSLGDVPRGAALTQAYELIEWAQKLGTSGSPSYSYDCSEEMLTDAEQLVDRHFGTASKSAQKIRVQAAKVRRAYAAARQCGQHGP